jgi:type I restriction enzyme S subunit
VSWPTATLGEITRKIGSGSTPRGGNESYKPCGIPLVRSMNVHDGEFVDDGLAYLDETQAAALKHVTLDVGDVLLNITGASVARVCRLPDQLSGGRVNQHVSIIRPDKNRLDTNFLAHLLRAPEAKARLLRVAGAGATREAITKAQIEEFRIPLPPLDEQRRIAAILDKADALRRKRKRALDLLSKLTQSIFLEMFISKPGFGDKVEVRTLGEICELIRDGVHKTPTYVETGVPFVTVKNIVGGTLDLTQTKFVSLAEHLSMTKRVRPEPGDVLVSKDGTIGVPCVVPEGPAFSIFVSVALLRLKQSIVDPIFLSEQIKTHVVQKQIRESSKGIAIRHLHLNDFAKLKIILPPITDQKRFTAIASSVRNRQESLVNSLARTDTLFSSLQHRAFSGQL